MRIANNELEIYRGETFCIDRTIINEDGSPYIISKQLNNPYFLITIASSKYRQDGRYVHNYWLDVTDLPRFNSTVALPLSVLGENYTVWDNVKEWPESGLNGYAYDECVFYIEDVEGNREYKYWDVNLGWQPYKLRIVKIFTTEDTESWTEQEYVYSILLVSGTTMTDYLRYMAKDYLTENELSKFRTDKELYNELLLRVDEIDEKRYGKLSELNVERMLANYDIVLNILIPTKLTVLANIRGGL